MSEEETKQLASLAAQTTINTVMSSIIIIISLIKPIILEYIERKYERRQEAVARSRRSTMEAGFA
jgi:hypothetical protein